MREKRVIDNNVYSREDAEGFLADYSRASSNLKKMEGEMELEINKIRKKYESKISEMADNKEIAFDKLEVFAQNNPELFEDKKSIDFTHGSVGFRTGTPKLKTLKGYTWPKVLEKVKKLLPDFVRSKEEIDKEELINRRHDENMKGWYKSIGVEIVQDETFYVNHKTEEVYS